MHHVLCVVLCWFEVTDPLLCCSSLLWDQCNTMALGFGYFFSDGITKMVLKWSIRKKVKATPQSVSTLTRLSH